MKLIVKKTQKILYQALIVLIIIVFPIACSHTTNQAPVRERQQPPSKKIFQHVVAPGETLFSIAWRYGLDYKRLAKTNAIGSSFVIHPGKLLDLRTNQRYSTVRQNQRYSDSKKSSKNATANSTKSSTTRTKRSQPNKSSKTVSTVQPLFTQKSNRNIAWRWPITGTVLNKFSGAQGLNKGIDIKAKKGGKIIATAAGTVVYAGSGLRGYGKLLIIKHNDVFLSAYGHNSRLRVKEADVVGSGQHIADVGSSGTDSSKLHFEIRRDGKPVDPLRYLPKEKE